MGASPWRRASADEELGLEGVVSRVVALDARQPVRAEPGEHRVQAPLDRVERPPVHGEVAEQGDERVGEHGDRAVGPRGVARLADRHVGLAHVRAARPAEELVEDLLAGRELGGVEAQQGARDVGTPDRRGPRLGRSRGPPPSSRGRTRAPPGGRRARRCGLCDPPRASRAARGAGCRVWQRRSSTARGGSSRPRGTRSRSRGWRGPRPRRTRRRTPRSPRPCRGP